VTQARDAAYGHAAIWRIAGPMILSAGSTPLLGMVDTAVVGHLPDPAYLGAVAIGATIFSALFMGLNFLRMGTTGITAQAFGANDAGAGRAALGQGLLTALLLAALLLLFRAPLGELAMRLLSPGPAVLAPAQDYYAIRIWSAPASLANFVLLGWLLGMQNARAALVMTLVINLSNILLDLWFVIGLGLGVRGVAAATLLAELLGAATGLLFVRVELRGWPGRWPLERLRRLRAYRRLLHINLDLFLRTLSLMFVFAFITARGARLGELILAANAVLMNFQFLQAYALDGIAYAAEALVGKALGRRDIDGLQQAVRRCLTWSLGFALLFTLAYWLGGRLLIELLTGIDAVRSTAERYLPWLVLLPLISVWSFLYDGVYVGATRSREMMLVMAGSALLLFLPAWYLGDRAGLGNHALWIAFTLFMAARGIGMHAWWQRLSRSGMLVPRTR